MTPEELAVILESHKRWLSDEDDGQWANLRWANLRWADLREANLREADLREANLRWADLREADLQGADLRWADLQGADLQGANLREADLRRADLQGADLQGANLQGADLDFSALPLWCGLLDIKCDQRLFAQVAYHLCRMGVPDELHVYQDALRDIARKFHRFDECGGLPDREEDKS